MKKLFLLVFILMQGVILSAQSSKVTGVVSDSQGPIAGVAVVIKGTSTGTVTDLDGRYEISAPKGAELVFTSLGYSEKILSVGTASVYNVELEASAEMLEELVVVGYGVQKKVNLTGSVSTVNFDKLSESRPVTTTSSLLAGASSGLYVRQTTADPGSEGISLTVRGLGTLNNSSPLVIVDGFECTLGSIDASDIQSISVLKDAASCAIYGNRGANGVILVTTKKAQKDKFSIEYNGIVGVERPLNTFKVVSNYADYMEFMNEAAENYDRSLPFSDAMIAKWRETENNPYGTSESGYPNYVAYPNVDGFKAIYKEGLPVYQKHNLSAMGGTDKIKYRMALSYMDNPGIIDKTGYNKFTYRTEVSAQITKWLEIGSRVFGSLSNKEGADYNSYAIRQVPCIYPEYDGKLGWVENPEQNSEARNNKFFINQWERHTKNHYINVTPYVNINLPLDIKWKASFNYRTTQQQKEEWTKPVEAYSFRTGAVVKSATALTDQQRRLTTYASQLWVAETDLSWAKTLAGKHEVSALVGFEAMNSLTKDHASLKKGAGDAVLREFNNLLTPSTISGTESSYASASVFGRVTYAYDSRYLAEFNLRYDGSSRFDARSRWGLFPSVSAAWRISKEQFMKGTGVDNLKLRVSWGKLGNNSIGNYDYQSTYSTGYSYPLGGTIKGGMISTLSNSLLKWETTSTTNAGFDFAMFDNRLTIDADYYYKFTDGILYKPTITMTIGTKSAPYMNLCQVSNQGVELSASWRDQISDFRYGISGNFSYNRNRVEKYKGQYQEGWVEEDGKMVWKTNRGDVTTGSYTRVCEGHMIDEYFLPNNYSGNATYFDASGNVLPGGGPKDGMIRTEADMAWLQAMMDAGYTFKPKNNASKTGIWYGDYILADRNGDGIYGDDNDWDWQGKSTTPKFYYGFNFEFGWKGIDLSVRFVGAGGSALFGRSGINHTILQTQQTISAEKAYDHYFYDPENPYDPRTNLTSRNQRFVIDYGQQNNYSTYWLLPSWFLKLQNVTLSYTFPSSLINKAKIQNLRIFLSGENLHAFKDKLFPFIDPEYTSTGELYAPISQFTVGLSIKF